MEAAYKPQKKKSPGKVVLVVFLFFLAGCIVAGSVLFCFGFGFPSQEMVAKELFSNPIAATDTVFADYLSDNKKADLSAMICQDPNAKVDAVMRSVNDSTVYVTGQTDKGSNVTYKIKMARSFLGWKITNIELSFASNN